uniref:Malonyl-CoA:ACP transacylase (MAT) domain-containing protein n=1 Tax=Acrobeloides nanus TaxID=290746 RepID=A0A914DLS2_9BILA
MRRVYLPLQTSIRGVRRRIQPPLPIKTLEETIDDRIKASTSLDAFGPMRNIRGKPASWLSDATTYADKNAAIFDPASELPYNPEDMEPVSRKQREEKLLRQKQKLSVKKRIGRISMSHIPIEEQVVILFPGQGSQHVGMGSKVVDHKPSMQLFERASEVLGYDLYELCKNGPKTKLDQTIYCQPAIFVSSLAAFEKLKDEENLEGRITDVAGFSVGEIAALVVAGVLRFDDALRLVKLRAEAMHECNQLVPSGMITIRISAASRLDDALNDAREAAVEAGERPLCEVANYLVQGVRVIGASNLCIDFLVKNADRYKIQVKQRIPVSGAFHTSLMEEAGQKLYFALKKEKFVTFEKPHLNVFSNYSGGLYKTKPTEMKKLLIKQVSEPVKWEQIQQGLFHRKKKVDGEEIYPTYIEVGPGKQLGAMLYLVSKKMHRRYRNYPC